MDGRTKRCENCYHCRSWLGRFKWINKDNDYCWTNYKAKFCLQDDILITTSTDIGWSPYFPLLKGVVTELGGIISHGAVIAREYGLPCVVGAAGATRAFKSGKKRWYKSSEFKIWPTRPQTIGGIFTHLVHCGAYFVFRAPMLTLQRVRTDVRTACVKIMTS